MRSKLGFSPLVPSDHLAGLVVNCNLLLVGTLPAGEYHHSYLVVGGAYKYPQRFSSHDHRIFLASSVSSLLHTTPELS
jgi:hypothetical protein